MRLHQNHSERFAAALASTILIMIISSSTVGILAVPLKKSSASPPKIVKDPETNALIIQMDQALQQKQNASMELQVLLQQYTIQLIQGLATTFQSNNIGPEGNVNSSICTGCQIFVGVFYLQTRIHKLSMFEVLNNFEYLCPTFGLITTDEVCIGMLERLLPTIYFIIKGRGHLKVEAFCGFALQQLGCNTDDPYLDWSVNLPKENDDPYTKNNETYEQSETDNPYYENDETESEYKNPNPNQKLVKIVQLTDVHLDTLYTYKSPAVCTNNALCCRSDSVAMPSETDEIVEAGFFADNHQCDPPFTLLEGTLKHLKDEHKDIKLFYMTGDLVPHNNWATTKESNTDVIKRCMNVIRKYFPNSAVRVIPVVGNHESHPVNYFSPPKAPEDLNTRWVYETLYSTSKQWIPNSERGHFHLEGFYAVEISEYLKVIALNTNVCYGFNLWGMYDVKDPGGQLHWLIRELSKSEVKGQSVHIIGHIPPGYIDCNKVFSQNFYKIITRFQKTVKAQFYGHTHYDELKLYYDPKEPEGDPISVSFISPSLTPYTLNNPAYKIFFVDPNTWKVTDYETWIFDLEEANETPEKEPIWFPLYKATEAYGMKDTSLKNLGEFVNRMAEDKTLFDLYYQHYFKALPRQTTNSTETTQKYRLCDISTAYYRDGNSKCNGFIETIDSQQS